MGDMADLAIDQGMDDWLRGDDYEDGEGYGPLPKTCRRCGAANLHWGILGGRYKLHNSAGELHVCLAAKANAAARKAFK